MQMQMWGDVGRCGEMWGDVAQAHAQHEPQPCLRLLPHGSPRAPARATVPGGNVCDPGARESMQG